MPDKSIEVFQELHLRSRSSVGSVRNAVLAQVKVPWQHDKDRENDLRSYAVDEEDVIVLVRQAFNDIDESGLVLWQNGDGYRVANIVPRHVGELGITKYNYILQDFVERIAAPAASIGNFDIEITPPYQSLADWIDQVPAAALQRFSSLANKSTGAAHPNDRERWHAFLIAAHLTPRRMDADQLVRWLIEVEHWPEERAHELAIDYEFALGLLEQYDQNRP